jgi:integrase
MGLGPVHTVTLAKARQKAHECRNLRLDNLDPIAERHAGQLKAKLEAAQAVTFRECAERYISAHKRGWKNEKHAAQWPSTLATYAYPVFGDQPVHTIETPLVLKAVEPLWNTKTETASRLRQRIEAVLDWATARGLRHGDNPARWRGHLDKLLPARAKVQMVLHHAALPYPEIGRFMVALRKHDGLAAAALELLILTATRTGEIIGAKWEEFDLKAAVWTIPADRMKAGREQRVPLSKPALALLKPLRKYNSEEFVFPGGKPGRPLSNMAMLALLDRMGRGDLTVHGFRSTFRDWAAERTSFPREVVEQALAHSLPDKVEAAYRRGDLIEKRRLLMDSWAKFCDQPASESKILTLRSR